MNAYKMPILDVLENIKAFSPVKICFNYKDLYNDWDFNAAGCTGESEPYDIAVPERLKPVLDNYDVWVTRFEVVIVDHHHSLIYMTGEKIRKGYYDLI
jgi:hypothetical protein